MDLQQPSGKMLKSITIDESVKKNQEAAGWMFETSQLTGRINKGTNRDVPSKSKMETREAQASQRQVTLDTDLNLPTLPGNTIQT